MFLEPLTPTEAGALPGELLTELTALYASNHAFHALSGDFPDPEDIRPEQVATALADELADPDTEVLLARSAGRLVGIAITLGAHPDPADDDPWIGLLMIDATQQQQGHGRQLASLVEDRFRAAGRTAVRLAVLDNNPRGLAFWTALGYDVVDHRPDRQLGRPCTVLRKQLRRIRHSARVAVLDPTGSVFLFRYDDAETGTFWALPGGGLEGDETSREGALRELREETGWTDLEPGPLLSTREVDLTFAGTPTHQHERIYVTHGPHREPTGTHLSAAHTQDGILAWRWWTREELRATKETVWPAELARLLDELDGQDPQA
ncbi:bifunctional GNAT family N-acetyltransferase/NUDIX hydrolase [Streptomyces sp. W16]|uniref:bifunctional GNAT family N-acetyltransferase/NUDIX hydrolase n=1 Tax=Streptomyces sp. W16 TaxID=3076631 RepID=UPI00295B7BA7|nr:bifunctional GNAT family N-acetyltransferase/NUDIX hydrolase [Streptomyces sp. W16]MDV9175007.1 bifunctional GNAT family N-acetyltransferase/NUDIX hydrolase [Streptomyces sp. W16]